MVLDLIPGKKIFVQRDVRETPAATATASAVGLTDKHYLVVDLDADLTEERALTAGEGIDFTDLGANSTLTINGENASDANKGIASFDVTDFTVTAGNVVLNAERISDLVGAMVTGNTETGMTVTYQDADNTLDFVNDGVTSAVAGEGIDVSAATGAVTISCEDATSANKGIAIFPTSDFTVAAGAVTIADERIADIVGAMVTGNTETGIAVTYQDADNTLDFVVGDLAVGGDVTGTLSSIQVDHVNIASIGTNTHAQIDTHIASTTLHLTNKTSYWSCSGVKFVSRDAASDPVVYGNTTGILPFTTNATAMAGVELPNGAIVTKAIVYGSSTDTWTLYRGTISNGTASSMATANTGTEDTTISDATIDNSLYYYFIQVTSTQDTIYGARITYTTNYD